MHQLFYLGAICMLIAMIWTIVTNPESKDLISLDDHHAEGFFDFVRQTCQSIQQMPKDTKKLCMMHGFTWFGLQCLFIFFSLYIAHNVFGANDPKSLLYHQAVQKASLAYCFLNAVCFIVSPFIGKLCEFTSKKAVHTVGLLSLAIGLTVMYFSHQPNIALGAMAFMGIGWATTLSVPFALLAHQAPEGKAGVLMGTFNISIAAPQFLGSWIAGFLVWKTGNYAAAMLLGGFSLLIATVLLQQIKE
jgi:maltose/moltooligosaccharide transporter